MIRIQNIYYMLAYAFQVLNEQRYKNVATEEFDNVAELCAAILVKGVSVQLKRGLGREYVSQTEQLSALRGRIDISESIKTQALLKKQLVCTYDDFSVNSYMNRIIKSTFLLLLRGELSKSRKKEIRKLLVFFSEVEELDVYNINWNIQYNRNNQSYRMLVSVCYLVVKGLLQTDGSGSSKLMSFLDEQRFCRLYEKFILNYYTKEFPDLKVSSSQIPWQLDFVPEDKLLPVMQSDIMLYNEKKQKTLIIDAKYYTHTTQTMAQYGSHTLHSHNLYQIFAYVKNKDVNNTGNVSGLLLYAKTDNDMELDNEYSMSGNIIGVKTLDLDCDFEKVKEQLNEIVVRRLI